MLNRRAQIGTILLLMVAFFLVGSALYSMITFKNSFSVETKSLDKLSFNIAYTKSLIISNVRNVVHRSIADARDSDSFESALRESIASLAETKRGDATLGDSMLKLKDYKISSFAGDYTLIVEDISYIVREGATEIKNNFDLKIILNKEGIVSVR